LAPGGRSSGLEGVHRRFEGSGQGPRPRAPNRPSQASGQGTTAPPVHRKVHKLYRPGRFLSPTIHSLPSVTSQISRPGTEQRTKRSSSAIGAANWSGASRPTPRRSPLCCRKRSPRACPSTAMRSSPASAVRRYTAGGRPPGARIPATPADSGAAREMLKQIAQTARTLGHKVMEDNGREGLVVCSCARPGFYNGQILAFSANLQAFSPRRDPPPRASSCYCYRRH
jgi:hypothetical protein